MGKNELESVFSGVNGGTDGVVFVMVVRQSAFYCAFVNEIDILAVQIIRV